MDKQKPKRKRRARAAAVPAPQAAWRIAEWCPAVRLSKSYIYGLPAELQPRSVRVGNSRLVVETPAEWLARMADVERDRVPA